MKRNYVILRYEAIGNNKKIPETGEGISPG